MKKFSLVRLEMSELGTYIFGEKITIIITIRIMEIRKIAILII